MILIAWDMVPCVYMESSVASLQPMIFNALVILSIVFVVCLVVFPYQTVIYRDRMLWLMDV